MHARCLVKHVADGLGWGCGGWAAIANPTIQITATTESTSEVQKYNNYKGGAAADWAGLCLNILNTQQVESGNGNGAHSTA